MGTRLLWSQEQGLWCRGSGHGDGHILYRKTRWGFVDSGTWKAWWLESILVKSIVGNHYPDSHPPNTHTLLGEACWWTMHPASKQRSEGEKVRVGDDLILVSVSSERYLVSNPAPDGSYCPYSGTWICHIFHHWHAQWVSDPVF